eukprot:TRINITY_DN12118_c0_g1_i7.p1 TRINITY_DN12118_c0_g1~~TRINITY_DN12118_c0_g1_i7.p1  ORF type:complete len:214 (+),score=17.12 TRINITY_DN12118_c0_g1_i7:127-768(+)
MLCSNVCYAHAWQRFSAHAAGMLVARGRPAGATSSHRAHTRSYAQSSDLQSAQQGTSPPTSGPPPPSRQTADGDKPSRGMFTYLVMKLQESFEANAFLVVAGSIFVAVWWVFSNIFGARTESRDIRTRLDTIVKDIGELKNEVKNDLTELKREVKNDLTELKREVKSDIREMRTWCTLAVVLGVFGTVLGFFGNLPKKQSLRVNGCLRAKSVF